MDKDGNLILNGVATGDRNTVDVLSRPDVVGFFVVKRLTDMHQNSAGSVHILFAHLYLELSNTFDYDT